VIGGHVQGVSFVVTLSTSVLSQGTQNQFGHSLSAEVLKDIRKETLYITHYSKWKGTHWLENIKERDNLETE